jgi:pilus assembly protein CpaE
MTVRVLLGAADVDLIAALKDQALELVDIDITGIEGTSTDVVSAVSGDPQVDVVLVHQNLGPLPALDVVRQLALRRPQMAVVLIAERMTAETFSSAMAAGARGVISREPALTELQSSINAAAEWSRTIRRHFGAASDGTVSNALGTMMALCGAKGGTGTTTLAIQLALAVAEAGRTVCLVDMDLQKGDFPTYLDVQHRRSIADMVPAAGDVDATILADTLYLHPAGPHVLLAPALGEQAEDVLASAARRILGALRSRYDVLIIDCGAHLNEGNATAVELADRVVVTTTPDLPSLRGAKRLAQLWDRLQLRRADDLAVVLVRHDKRNEIQPDFARKVLGLPLLRSTVPAAFRSLEEAANTGSPTAAGHAGYRRAVGQIARETGLLTQDSAAGVGAGRGRAGGGRSGGGRAGGGRRGGRAGGRAGGSHRAAGNGAVAPEPSRSDSGAALIEFAAIIGPIALVLLLVWQAVLVGLTSMYASHAANEGARAVAVLGYDTPAARAEVRRRTVARVGGSWGDRKHLRLAVEGGYVRVTIATPAVLPGWRTPFGITTKAKIVNEGGGLLR